MTIKFKNLFKWLRKGGAKEQETADFTKRSGDLAKSEELVLCSLPVRAQFAISPSLSRAPSLSAVQNNATLHTSAPRKRVMRHTSDVSHRHRTARHFDFIKTRLEELHELAELDRHPIVSPRTRPGRTGLLKFAKTSHLNSTRCSSLMDLRMPQVPSSPLIPLWKRSDPDLSGDADESGFSETSETDSNISDSSKCLSSVSSSSSSTKVDKLKEVSSKVDSLDDLAFFAAGGTPFTRRRDGPIRRDRKAVLLSRSLSCANAVHRSQLNICWSGMVV